MTAADDVLRLRALLTVGKSADAVTQALALAKHAPDPGVRADALLARVAGMINLGRRDRMRSALNDAVDAIRAVPTAERTARLYAYAAIIAHLDEDSVLSVTHLVRSARALAAVQRCDEEISGTWHELAMAYSSIGFHGYALSAMEEARKQAVQAGQNDADLIAPVIRVRLAVARDHLGDSEACKRVLRGVIDDLPRHRELQEAKGTPMRPSSRLAYGFAVARLATLGEIAVGVEMRPLLDHPPTSQRIRDFRTLAAACVCIATGRPDDGLRRLAEEEVSASTVGEAEPFRLRALAHLAAGRPADAYAEDRKAFRAASAHAERVREAYVESIAARLELEQMRLRLERFEGEAFTDPLTGLPNRRFLEQRFQELTDAGRPAMVAVCDLDGFKQVNDVHGHLIGDLVLQRVAAILAQVIRRGDLVARFGGDEFVVVMPDTRVSEGTEIAARIADAVRSENWTSIAPDTPIGVTIGWAYTDAHAGLHEVLAAADHAMLREKKPDRPGRRHGPQPRHEVLTLTPRSLAS